MRKTKEQKGITLVALVITIILLLILAGVSIQAITNTGLFEGASQAKKETQRAQVTEWLNLKLIEEQAKNPTGTAEEIIEATRTASKCNAELAKFGKNVVVDENTSTKEDGETVEVYFYVQVDEDVYKVDMTGAKFIGEKGKFPPVIIVENVTNTTNSITIKIKTSRNEEGKIEFYIKKEGETEYTSKYTAEGEEAKGLEYTFTGLEQNKSYSIKIVATKNGQTKEIIAEETTLKVQNSVAPSEATTHTAKAITYNWDELSSIAKMISNNSSITNDTLEVNVKLNGVDNTLGVGDTATVDSKTVRILGFNHDTLTNAQAYGEQTATGKAGISFEYVDFLTSAQMNSSDTNSGGWGVYPLRSTLNSTTYNSLSIKNNIKQVQKEFIQTYNNANSKTTSSDYLWLLSCGEIWNNGYNGGIGYAITGEGNQYKYYKIGNPTYNSSTDYTKKPNVSSASYWWLRSPSFIYSYAFCFVYSNGTCGNSASSSSYGVAPGFSI